MSEIWGGGVFSVVVGGEGCSLLSEETRVISVPRAFRTFYSGFVTFVMSGSFVRLLALEAVTLL